MPRTPNNDSPNDMDDMNAMDDETAVRGARAAQDRDNRARDEDGRFTGNRQTRSRDDDTGGGRGRGWFGDPQGHAQAGSRSHDNTRNAPRNQADDRDDDRYDRRTAEGPFAAGRNAADRNQSDDEADFGAWHAYGHNRGWHGYQRRGNADMSANISPDRSEQNRSGSGRGVGYDDVRSYAGRGQDYSRNTRGRDHDEDDDYRRMTSQDANRQRDGEGRFTSNRH